MSLNTQIMPKPIVLFLLLSIAIAGQGQAVQHHHNKVDDVKTSDDANALFKLIAGKYYSEYVIEEKLAFKNGQDSATAKSANAVTWSKADFDCNGFTDILLIPKDTATTIEDNIVIICIMDSGFNKFYFRPLTTSFSFFSIASLNSIDDKPSILFYHYKKPNITYIENGKKLRHVVLCDTLIFRFDDFVEYNRNKTNYNIKNVNFKTSSCFGLCPVFEINIDETGKAIFNASDFNEDTNRKQVNGKFTALLDSLHVNEIKNILNYKHFPTLEKKYSVPWTDDQTGYLTITYNDGKTKIIEDYGMQGTFGLRRLYQLLSNLRFNQNWH